MVVASFWLINKVYTSKPPASPKVGLETQPPPCPTGLLRCGAFHDSVDHQSGRPFAEAKNGLVDGVESPGKERRETINGCVTRWVYLIIACLSLRLHNFMDLPSPFPTGYWSAL